MSESIIEELEENLVDITIGSSDRIKGSDFEVFKISCTTRKKLITDTHIDPNHPINIIPHPCTTKLSLNVSCVKESITPGQ